MSLIKSKQPQTFTWKPGDLITATEAAALLGYKSSKSLRDVTRRQSILRDFAAVGCPLTCDIWIGGGLRFIRSEIDLFLSRTIEAAQNLQKQKHKKLSLLA